MSWNLPVGTDFADGVTLLPAQPTSGGGTPVVVGTRLPTASITIWDSFGQGTISPQEPPGSPTIERAEQCTCEHNLEMSWVQCKFYLPMIGRGVVVTDTAGQVWRVLSCKIQRKDGTTGSLSYVMESVSFDSPPDDFDIKAVSLDLNIVKHPRYWWCLSPYITDNSTFTLVGDTKIYYTAIKESIIRMIQNYVDSPFYPSQTQVQGLIQSNILSMVSLPANASTGILQIHYPNVNYDGSSATAAPVAWDGTNANLPTVNCVYFAIAVSVNLNDVNNPITIALAAAQEIISKLWRQEDTPYLIGYEVTWTQYFFQPVFLNPGGYTEDPRLWVPSYFIVPGGAGDTVPRGITNGGGLITDTVPNPPSGTQTIFDLIVSYNPQSYSSDGTDQGQLQISSLRQADDYHYERTWFAVTHKWLIAPLGKWDIDLYPPIGQAGPQDANDFNINPNSRTDL